VHPYEVPRPPSGTRLPLLVLVAEDRRVLAFQGYPSYEELRELTRALLEKRAPDLQGASQ